MKNRVKQFVKSHWQEMAILGVYTIGAAIGYACGVYRTGYFVGRGMGELAKNGMWFVPAEDEVGKFNLVKLEDLKK